MERAQRHLLPNRSVGELSAEGKATLTIGIATSAVSGFGSTHRVRRSISCISCRAGVQGRGPGGRSKRATVGRHGVIPADDARRRAKKLLAAIRAGDELDEGAGPTVAEVAVWYLREQVAVRCKPRTQEGYRQVIHCNVVPPRASVVSLFSSIGARAFFPH